MSIDAIALLPPLELPSTAEMKEEEGWFTVNLPGTPSWPFKPLKDGTLVMLGLRFAYPDEDLYDQCAAWLSHTPDRPSRVWETSAIASHFERDRERNAADRARHDLRCFRADEGV